jgi:DNA-binding PadR family transcriptional regulator
MKRTQNGSPLHFACPPTGLAGEPAARGESGDREESASGGHLPDIAYVILGHIAASAQGIHGYQLGRLLARPGLRLPSLRLGQLYRLLRRLERAGLVACHVESESARLRYRFTITPQGEAHLHDWLASLHGSSGSICQQLLYRLRFAERLPVTALLRLIDDAMAECRNALEEIGKAASAARDRRGEVSTIYEHALKTRLATDRCWLEEIRRLVQRGAAADSAKAGTGA